MTVLGTHRSTYQQLGVVQTRTGNIIPFTAPRNAYETSDGKLIAMSSSNQASAARLFEAVGNGELIDDEPRFDSNAGRVATSTRSKT